MAKQKTTFEYALNAGSENIIWQFLSTVDGLSMWMSDNVSLDGNVFTFSWGVAWKHLEERSATIIEQKKNSFIRLRWDDDEDPEDYWELKISKHEITDDYSLLISGFYEPSDISDQKELWDNAMEKFHRNSGM
jgi:hypothetical protein